MTCLVSATLFTCKKRGPRGPQAEEKDLKVKSHRQGQPVVATRLSAAADAVTSHSTAKNCGAFFGKANALPADVFLIEQVVDAHHQAQNGRKFVVSLQLMEPDV